MSNVTTSLQTVRAWIKRIGFDAEAGEWQAEIKPNHQIRAETYASLVKLIREAVGHEVVLLAAEKLDVDPAEIYCRNNHRPISDGRAVVAAILHRNLRYSLIEAATVLKYTNKNHSNAYFAMKRAETVAEIIDKKHAVIGAYECLRG